MPEKPVAPVDCAIGVGIPLSRASLIADLQNPCKDFARAFQEEYLKGSSGELLWNFYEPRANTVLKMLADVSKAYGLWPLCRKQGATVNHRLTLDGFRQMFENHHVITVLTHMAFPTHIAPHDIVDPFRLLHSIKTQKGVVQTQIFDACPELFRNNQSDPEQIRIHVAKILTSLIHRSRGVSRAVNGISLPMLGRLDLEDALAPDIVPARIVEFFDGMRTWRELLDAIPETFDGILDLSLCYSLGLGETLKRYRPGCLIITNRHVADLTFRALFYRSVIMALRAKPQLFTEVSLRLHEILLEEL